MNNRWKIALALSAGLFCLWLVTFVVEWHNRTGWQQYWLDGGIRAWANFSMLGWFDQTIMAGLFAFGGGAFVYFAARQQRRDQVADRNATNREFRLGQLTEVRRLLIALGHRSLPFYGSLMPSFQTFDPATLQSLRDDLAALKVVLTSLNMFAPTLAHVISKVASDIQVAIDANSSLGHSHRAPDQLNSALSIAETAAGYFTPASRLLDPSGRFVHIPKETDRTESQIPGNLRWLFEFK